MIRWRVHFCVYCFWVRYSTRGPGWHVKFPWDRPLFSERYGHKKPSVSFLGVRLFRLQAIGGQTMGEEA